MVVIEDLNLNTTIKIGNKELTFELYTIYKGFIKEIKLNNDVFVLNNSIKQSNDENNVINLTNVNNINKLNNITKVKKKGGRPVEWTEKKNQYIRDNYGKIPTKDIAKYFGKSEKAIRDRAIFLGVANDSRGGSREKKSDDKKAPNSTMLFLNWLEKRATAFFTLGDIVKDLSLSKEKAIKIIDYQLTLGTLQQLSDYEFAKRKKRNKFIIIGLVNIIVT